MNDLTPLNGNLRDADAIDAVRQFIVEGDFRPGDRLPAERALIGSLGMTRTTLRKALDALEREGAIWRHVGKGTFISGRSQGIAGELSEITQQATPVKMIRARLTIEPAIAREAAINASTEALTRIRRAEEAASAAANWDEYEANDDRLHRLIAEATDNLILLSLFDNLNRIKRAVAWNTVVRRTAKPPEDYVSFAEHTAIVGAIEARDPVAAHDAMRKHIGSVSARIFRED